MEKIFKLLQGSVEKNSDKLELYVLNNLFKIPDDVVLPEPVRLLCYLRCPHLGLGWTYEGSFQG